MTDLTILRDELAALLAEKRRIDALVADAKKAWETEMAEPLQAQRDLKQAWTAQDAVARGAIKSYREETGASPDLIGFSVQMREAIEYDTLAMIAWAEEYAPELVETRLVGETAIKAWIGKHAQEATDFATGEKCHVVSGPTGLVRVPVTFVQVVTPVISENALLTWQGEREYNRE